MHLTRTKKQQALVRISLLSVLFRHGGKAQQDKQCLLTYGPLNGKLNTTNLSQGSPSVRSSHTLISFYAFCDFFCNLSQFFRLKKEEKMPRFFERLEMEEIEVIAVEIFD